MHVLPGARLELIIAGAKKVFCEARTLSRGSNWAALNGLAANCWASLFDRNLDDQFSHIIDSINHWGELKRLFLPPDDDVVVVFVLVARR